MKKNSRGLVYILLILVAFLGFSACGRLEGGTRDVISEEDEYNEGKNGEEGDTSPTPGISDPSTDVLVDSTLHPYARSEGYNLIYGYSDSKGNVVIEPAFKYAEPFFDCGLAPVTTADDKKGLIDIDGNYVVIPEWDYIAYSEGSFICYQYKRGYSHIFDEKGSLQFEYYGYIGAFSEGLIPSYDDSARGYVDKKGVLTIPLDYDELGQFVNGVAEVAQSYMGPSYYIDKAGNDLTDTVSSGLRMYEDTDTSLFGYMNNKGEIVIPAIFGEAAPFLNGYAVVNASSYIENGKYGVIDTNGNYVLEPVYCGITRLGNGLVAVGEKIDPDDYAPYEYYDYSKKALFTPDFKKSTEWLYYMVSNFDNENVCVNDSNDTLFISKSLNKSNELPSINGRGQLIRDNDMLRGYYNGKLTVFDKKGRIISQVTGNIDLGDGLVSENSVRIITPAAKIAFPAMAGINDQALQDKINNQIIAEMIEPYEDYATFNGPEDTLYLDAYYTLVKKKDLLLIDQYIYMNYLGAVHGYTYRNTVYIDSTTGVPYGLSDLLRKDSGVWDYLSVAVTEKMLEKMEEIGYFEESLIINSDSFFALSEDGIDFYYAEGEIASYAAGMQVFHIPYSDLSGFIDTEGAFWKAFN